jgi:hypothetical protein
VALNFFSNRDVLREMATNISGDEQKKSNETELIETQQRQLVYGGL